MNKSFLQNYLVLWFLTVASPLAHAFIAQEMDTVVVTATRLEEDSYKIAGNLSVITKEQIKESNAQTVPDILKESLGVLVYDNGTVKTSVVDIRGFGDTAARNVLILVNGRKVNTPDISGADLLQIPIEAVERIEIIRGAGSVLYGDNAVGGVINIITKNGKGNISGKVGVNYGSYDRNGVDVEVSGEKSGVSYFVYSKYQDDNGYRQNSDVFAKDFNTRFGYEFSENLSVDMDFGYHKDDFGLPGGLTLAEIASLGKQGSATPNDFAETEDVYVKLTAEITPFVEESYLGDLIVDLYYRDRDVFDSFDFSPFGIFNSARTTGTKGFTTKYAFDSEILDRDVDFVTGIDYYDYENDILGSASNTDDLTISKEEVGIFSFLEFELIDQLFVNGGSRYHQAEYTFNQRNVITYEKQRPDEWVNMAGIKYEYAKGSNVHLNFQETFRFLSTDEWYSSFSGLNTALEQQTGWQVETGVKHNIDDKMIFTVTPYFIKLQNEIFFNPSLGFFGSNDNYDTTQRTGVEIGTKWDMLKFFDIDSLDKLDFFANYTYQEPIFSSGANDGKQIPMVPRAIASHGVFAQFLKYYNFSLIGRYVGSRYAINDVGNTTGREKGYYVLDGKIAFEMDNLEVFASVNNITDLQYSPLVIKSASSSTKDFFPAPESNYLFGVNVKF